MGAVDRGLQFRVIAVHRELRELLHDRFGRVDEETRIGRAEHAGVVVRIAGGDDLEVQRLQRIHRVALLVGLAQFVVAHEAGGVDHELVAKECRPAQLAHQRVGEFVEGVRQDDHLEARAQLVQEVLGTFQRRHAAYHVLDVRQLQPVVLEQADAKAHQLVVVGLVARGAHEFGNAGALGKLDPDLGDQHAFEVEADNLHGGFRADGGLGLSDGRGWYRSTPAARAATPTPCGRGWTSAVAWRSALASRQNSDHPAAVNA
jgi:hypothetical protein